MMQTWYNFKTEEIIVEPESTFEQVFLTDLFKKTNSLVCNTVFDVESDTILGLSIKSGKVLANNSDLTEEDITIMYDEMEAEGVLDDK